jgi:hypothetical protein
LILTEPGLSPIYGAVLESRRIFARMKSYVVYRFAASIILVLTLSIIIFVSGCAVDSLLVIILALLNDISMIPVAYDNAQATTRPQLPNAKKIVMMSMFYGAVHTAGSLAFIFALDEAASLKYPISLESECNAETRGFIWYHLVLVTELMIFSVRAPSFFLLSMPSIYLVASVISTCIGASFIAVYASDLHWLSVAWIALFNLGMLVISDLLKIWVRGLLDDSPGDVITSDELLEVAPIEKTDIEKHMRKKLRYVVHSESVLPVEDRQHMVRIRTRRKTGTGLDGFFNDIRGSVLTDGFISKGHEKRVMLTNTNMVSGMPDVRTHTERYKQMSSPL